MTMKPGTQVITFRVPQDLKERIERAATENDRSVNNFLTHIIGAYLDAYEAKKRIRTKQE